MTEKDLRLCQNCKWSQPERTFERNNRCFHPNVNALDYYALSMNSTSNDNRGRGTDCAREREKRWPFAACGMRGALYEENKEMKR